MTPGGATPAPGTDAGARPLLWSMVLLCLAGAGQQSLLLAGHARLGIWLVAPAVVCCYSLWRPRGASLALLLGLLGIQALLPLHTGGGRVQDWLLHYEVSRHYAGLSSPVSAIFLSSRTALFHQLLGGLLAWLPAYWAYQVGAALLQGLWLWPASMLVRLHDGAPGRLVAVVIAPVMLAYSLYTWPWCFAAFFLLTAVLLAHSHSAAAPVGIGVALAGALLAHPGSIGYVVGVAAWMVVRNRGQVPVALAAGGATALTQVPWLLSLPAGHGGLGLLASTDPIRQAVAPAVWLATRLLVAAHSVLPFTPLVPQAPWADLLVVFFIASLPGALALTWLAAGRVTLPRGAALWAVVGGWAIGWAIDPPQQAMGGMLDVLFLGILLLVVTAAAEAPDASLRRLVMVQAATAALFLASLALVTLAAGPGDLNFDYRLRYRPVFLVERFGVVPGIALLALAGVAAGFRSRRGAGRRKTGGSHRYSN